MEFADPPKEDQELYKKVFMEFPDRILVSKGKCVLISPITSWYPKYNAFECRPSDVWVASYPKSGTTWTQEMVWCIMNDLDLEAAKKKMLMERFPFFEWDSLLAEDLTSIEGVKFGPGCSPGEQWKIVNELSNPRTIKTHFHHELLPKGIHDVKSKIIYVCRDPRDVCTSYFHHCKKFDAFVGSFDEFFDMFLEDKHLWSPYWTNVLDYWNKRNETNYLFLCYEDLKKNLRDEVHKVAAFLGKTLDDSKMDAFLDHLSFDKMKDNVTVNNENLITFGDEMIPFMRKGKVGDWKNAFSDDQKKRFKEWMKKNVEGTDFPYYLNDD